MDKCNATKLEIKTMSAGIDRFRQLWFLNQFILKTKNTDEKL